MVTYDGEDVTSQAAITNVTTGEPVENAAWTTTEIGEYKFQAVYDSYTSDPVTVSAIDKNKDKDKEFYRYVLLLKFTYMTCGNCVTAQGYFDALDEADRDHFLVVAAHQPEGMPMDPYWCSEGISLKSKMVCILLGLIISRIWLSVSERVPFPKLRSGSRSVMRRKPIRPFAV